MATHPANLILRFLLELTVLASVGYWGWKQSDGWVKTLLAVGLPLLMAAIWGTFAVPDDPSRSGSAVVVTPGIIRLIIEIGFFACAIWALYDMELPKSSLIFGIIVFLHYVLSYDRIVWLLSR